MPQRIIFTGGSGKAGRHLINHLTSAGHSVLNLDLTPLQTGPPPPGGATNAVHTIRTDLTSPGQVFSALSSHFSPSEPLPAHHPAPADAIIHFAGLSTPLQVPDTETYRINVVSAYNILEAATKLGIRKIILASSVTVYGSTFSQGATPFPEVPLTEDSPAEPTDVYALSKVCIEKTAAGFAKRFADQNLEVYVLRIGRVVAPEEYGEPMWRSYVEEPEKWAVHGWCYTDVRDLGALLGKALEARGLGYRVWNAVNDSVTNYRVTRELLGSVMPGVEWRRELVGREAPVSNRAVKEDLGWREEWDWVDLVDPAWAAGEREDMLARERALKER
jgi:nucleoside-diphosphate-sugar epimerase